MSNSGILLETVRVSNFRALRNLELNISGLTILIGSNNAGKTSFLDALGFSLGIGRRTLSVDDVYLAPDESAVPDTRTVVVDVRLRPNDEDGKVTDAFPKGGFWVSHFGTDIAIDDENCEFVGIRTEFSRVQGEYVLQRKFLKEWLPIDNWAEAGTTKTVSSKQIEPLALQYVDAKRDLEDDLRRQGSFWGRLTSDLKLAKEDVQLIESQLSAVNDEIIGKSEVLGFVKENLAGVESVINPGESQVEIAPIPSQLRDITRGISVNFTSYGKQSFPLARHGMGTRSLSSLLVFSAYVTWKQQQASAANSKFLPLLALEEPEAHLHPQSQRSLFSQVMKIPGQRIVSTHSPYFAAQARLEDLRLFSRTATGVEVSSFESTQLKPEERRKIDRYILATRGDLLFAKALIFCEGETEEQFLPLLAETFWGGRSLHQLGICFVGVGGKKNYFPFVFLANQLRIPYYIFSDGEPDTKTDLESCMARVNCHTPWSQPNIKVIPNNQDFEGHLIESGYHAEAETALSGIIKITIEEYMTRHDGKPGRKIQGVSTIRNYSSAGGRERALMDALREHKARVAPIIAEVICGSADTSRRTPPTVKELLHQISSDLKLQKFVAT